MASVFPPLLEARGFLQTGDEAEHSGIGGAYVHDPPLLISQDNALIAPRNPLGILAEEGPRETIMVYTVQEGDAPLLIAKRFGVSLNTILWANSIKNPNLIKAGDQLVVLPVSGVRYEVKQGDTLESIAQRFKPRNGDIDISGLITDIIEFNGLLAGELLAVGTEIIIPDGEIAIVVGPARAPPSRSVSSPQIARGVEEISGYYMRPILAGRRSRGIHGMNGVDLADTCGLPILASAAGTVILAKGTGWNGGYGKYVIITHPNGTQTLYAHLSAIDVTVGQKVPQGLRIGDIGSTGNSTGCHVHFEVRGAKNPF